MTTKNRVRAATEIRKLIGPISFAEMLHSYREAQEYSQARFAELLGISKQDLCNIEKGRKLVSVERAISFAKKLKMPPKTFAQYALQDQLNKSGFAGEVLIKDLAA